MSGNVWEWCWDSLYREYKKGEAIDPDMDLLIYPKRVYRGGGYFDRGEEIHVSNRNRFYAYYQHVNIGFRF